MIYWLTGLVISVASFGPLAALASAGRAIEPKAERSALAACVLGLVICGRFAMRAENFAELLMAVASGGLMMLATYENWRSLKGYISAKAI